MKINVQMSIIELIKHYNDDFRVSHALMNEFKFSNDFKFFTSNLIIFCQQEYLSVKKHIYRGKKKLEFCHYTDKIYTNAIDGF